MNVKCPPLSQVFEYLVHSCWCYLGSPKGYNIIGSMFLEAGCEILNFLPFLVHCHCFMLAVQDVSPYVSAPATICSMIVKSNPLVS